MQRFGEKLRFLREQRQLTQRQLAAELGFTTHAFIGFLEVGKKKPSAELVLKVSNYFGVSTDALLRDELEVGPVEEGGS